MMNEESQKGVCKIFGLETHTFFSCVNTIEVESQWGHTIKAELKKRSREMFKGKNVFNI